VMQGLGVHGAAAWKRRQLTKDCKNAAETGADLLHRVMSAFGTKRTCRLR